MTELEPAHQMALLKSGIEPPFRLYDLRHTYGTRAIEAAYRLLGQWRGTQHYDLLCRTDDDALTWEIVELASEYGRYGYRRITALLRDRGWHVLY